MRTLAVSFYDVVLWLHISAVVVGFGSTFAYAVLLTLAPRDNPRAVPGILAAIQANDRTVVTSGALIVLLTGLYLTLDAWEFSDFFIGWGILAVLVLIGLTHGFFIPSYRRGQELAERDAESAGAGDVELGAEFNRVNSKLGALGALSGLIIILTIYVMTAKPFL